MDTPTNKSLQTRHGTLPLPAYLPDATLGVVRSVDSQDLLQAGVNALVMNTYHLMQRPGSSTIQSLGGLHTMSAWDRPIVTDSGGFQAYSLFRQNARAGGISDRGLTFSPEGAKRKFTLTPEKSVQLQLSYGSDIVICLDDCTSPEDVMEQQRLSVKRTIAWGRRCKKTFMEIVDQKGLTAAARPLIFGVVQGGRSPELRKECAEALLEIGFDGYGYGGWPIDSEGSLVTEMFALLRELIPSQYPLHALGIGHPQNILAGYNLGYQIFDSAMPTRDARHGRLYCLINRPGRGLRKAGGSGFPTCISTTNAISRTASPFLTFVTAIPAGIIQLPTCTTSLNWMTPSISGWQPSTTCAL